VKGLLWGVLGLTFLDLILMSPLEIPKAGKALAKWIEDWMNPAVPLLSQQASTKSSTGTAPTIPPIPPIVTTGFQFPGFGGSTSSLPPANPGGNVNTGASIALT